MLAGDRVSGTDADRHEDISHNGRSGFGDNVDSATADLDPIMGLAPSKGWLSHNAQIAAPIHIGCPKNDPLRLIDEGTC